MTSVSDDPNTLLDRKAAAAALTTRGYKTAISTLATKATRGGGPPFRLFGRKPVYRLGDLIAWAENRLSTVRGSTSE